MTTPLRFSHRSIGIVLLAASWLPAGCSKKPILKAAHASRTAVETTVTTTSSGTVEADQQAILGFSAPGRVSQVLIHPGERVKKGQLLARLENLDLETISGDAERELKRADELFSSGLVSRVALDEARKNVQIARANRDKSVIRAPFDGVVTEVNLEIGELAQVTSVNPALPPLRLVDLKPRLVKGRIDEVDLAKIHAGSRARIKIPAVGSRVFAAEVSRVVPFVNSAKEQDRTSQVELRIPGSDSTLPVGASADIEIVVDSKSDALAVPTRALLGHTGAKYVFRAVAGQLVKTVVTTGIGNYDRTELLSGVQAGDLVVYPPEDRDLVEGLKIETEAAAWP